MDAMAFDVNTAAKMTGLSEHTLRQYIRKGWLKVTRCGRRVLIPVESLQKLVREGAPSRSGSGGEQMGDKEKCN
jgi:excisionase family DNA binding protein